MKSTIFDYRILVDRVRPPDKTDDKTDQKPEISPTDLLRGLVGLVGLLNTLQ